MSRNFSARSGDGDAASSNRKEHDTNVDSGSSSYRGRTDDESVRWVENAQMGRNCDFAGFEGPYGDSPPEHQRQCREEYFILMLNDPDNSTPSSEFEHDHELYSLKKDYIQKLNIVRRRLNLIDIRDNSCNSSHEEGCRITEIAEEQEFKEDVQNSEMSQHTDLETKCNGSKNSFSFKYNNLHETLTSGVELEYTPPKKKSCNRLKTPNILTSPENNIPYHTKVTLRDNLFKNTTGVEGVNNIISNDWVSSFSKFTKNKETQCDMQTNFCSNQNYDTIVINQKSFSCQVSGFEDSKNLFPDVIVKQYFGRNSPSSTISPEENEIIDLDKISAESDEAVIQQTDNYFRITTPQKSARAGGDSFSIYNTNVFTKTSLLNFANESTEENYDTGTTSTTTILDDVMLTQNKNTSYNKNKPKKSCLWNNIKHIQSYRLHGGSEKKEKQYLANKKKGSQKYTIPKSGYNVKTSVISNKNTKKLKNMPFGPEIVVEGREQHYMQHRYFYFSSDTDYNSSIFESDKSPRGPTNFRSCWENLINWLANMFRKQ